jgi:lauroyl/myristoyl acyltransferase
MRVWIVRGLEKFLPGFVFRAVVSPVILARTMRGSIAARAALQQLTKSQQAFAKPVSCLSFLRARYQNNLSELVRHWPDRLCEPRWQSRCELFGEEVLRNSLATGRPLILPTLHYGATLQMYHWLRASGLDLAAMTAVHYVPNDPIRVHYARRADRLNGQTGLRWGFGTNMDDLFDINQFLSRPNRLLLMAIDGLYGKRTVTTRVSGLSVNVQLGGFTLAAVTNAIMIPCIARPRSRMHCEIHFRTPVPDELVLNRKNRPAAAEHVVRELAPLIAECPEHADGPTLLCVEQQISRCDAARPQQPSASTNRSG